MAAQPGIALPVPAHAHYLTFQLRPGAAPAAREALEGLVIDDGLVVGLGLPLVRALGAEVRGLRDLPPHSGPGCAVPATPAALWCWLRGEDRGEVTLAARGLTQCLAGAFELERSVGAFRFREGLDLTGYVDGTENPEGEAAERAAFVRNADTGLDGSSFVAVQEWRHDLARFEAKSAEARDLTFGRRLADDQEIDDAPSSAHVKRTAQEDFEPEAFVLRRSMPWADACSLGLVFVAFGHSLDAFDALMRRMVGADDGVVDALFGFTRPLTGAGFWCPPASAGGLDLSALASTP